jgi:hypothetical protein
MIKKNNNKVMETIIYLCLMQKINHYKNTINKINKISMFNIQIFKIMFQVH